MPTPSVTTVTDDRLGAVSVHFDERGEGRPVLLLHGGGGPRTVGEFAAMLADTRDAHVLTPTHPGFGWSPRPDALRTVGDLAATYVGLLDTLGLTDVTVVGNSIGGWIAAEMGLLRSPRIAGIVLVDAVGIEVAGHAITDFFALTMGEVAQLSYFDPDAFGFDPSTLPPDQQAVVAANRAALAVYGSPMSDPTLRGRLAGSTRPTLVLWGEADRIVDPDYGRAYAAAIPGARFRLIPESGHLPQLETPRELSSAIWDFVETDAARRRLARPSASATG
jgi:pimeloyl-ACP methyl ester carboxylesterase